MTSTFLRPRDGSLEESDAYGTVDEDQPEVGIDANDPDLDEPDEDANVRSKPAYLTWKITPQASPSPAPNGILTSAAPTPTSASALAAVSSSSSMNTDPDVAASLESLHIEVAKTEKPNIISIHVFMRIPMAKATLEQLHPQSEERIAPTPAALPVKPTPPNNPIASSASSSSSSSAANGSSSNEPLPMTSSVTILSDDVAVPTSDRVSTLVRFSIPLYNFAKHNYLAASAHLLHSYPTHFAHLLQDNSSHPATSSTDGAFSEETLSTLIEKAVEQSYQLWASREKTVSNTALISVLSSLKISWDCASAMLDEEVELNDLLFLSESDIKTFVPKMGPRKRLTKWIEQEKETRRRRKEEESRGEDRTEAEDGSEPEEVADDTIHEEEEPHDVSSSPHLSPLPADSNPSASPTPFSPTSAQSYPPDHSDADEAAQPESSKSYTYDTPTAHEGSDIDVAEEEGDAMGDGTTTRKPFPFHPRQLHRRMISSGIDESDAHTDHPTEGSDTEQEQAQEQDLDDDVDGNEPSLSVQSHVNDPDQDKGEDEQVHAPIASLAPQIVAVHSTSVLLPSPIDPTTPVASSIATTIPVAAIPHISHSPDLDDSLEPDASDIHAPVADEGYEGHSDESDSGVPDHTATTASSVGSSTSHHRSSDEEKLSIKRNNSDRKSTGTEEKSGRKIKSVHQHKKRHSNPNSTATTTTTTPTQPGLVYTDEHGQSIPLLLHSINGVLYAVPAGSFPSDALVPMVTSNGSSQSQSSPLVPTLSPSSLPHPQAIPILIPDALPESIKQHIRVHS